MSLTNHVALVSLTSSVPTGTLMRVAAALQKQVTRDLAPIWGLDATVDAFEQVEGVPSDYFPVLVFGEASELERTLERAVGSARAQALLDRFTGQDLGGLHLNAYTRQPFALVAVAEGWPVIASHEVCELLVDPFGSTLRAGRDQHDGTRRVRYLVEVCDPCQAVYYTVNGVPVADFYTPRFFDPVPIEGARYSFCGAIHEPLKVLEGGYITWIDPADEALYQLSGGPGQTPRLLAPLSDVARSGLPLRAFVDGNPRTATLEPHMLRPASLAGELADGAASEAAFGAGRCTVDVIVSLLAGLRAQP
jgi:hypothetical protein